MSNIGGFFRKIASAISSVWAKESTLTNGADSFTEDIFHGGDVTVVGNGDEVVRLSNANSVTTEPDILMNQQGLISAESNLFLKSETGIVGFYFGGPGSGTNGATERARINSLGDFQTDRYISQGSTASITPQDVCTFSQLRSNYFNDLTYFRDHSIHNLGLWVPFTSSAGGSGMWGVIPNDGSGNWHMFWNTTDGTPGPTRCANGIAFEWEVNDFAANDSLILKSADYGLAGSNIAWQNAITVRPSVTATGAVGIKRVPTTYDFEVQGSAAKTTNGNWIFLSDRKLKENINDLELGLDAIKQLEPKTFNLKSDPNGKLNVGYIAQDVEKTDFAPYSMEKWIREDIKELPEGAEGEPQVVKTEFLALNDQAIVPTLVNAIKELSAKVDELENKLNGVNSNRRN